jgi:hypothetical protein
MSCRPILLLLLISKSLCRNQRKHLPRMLPFQTSLLALLAQQEVAAEEVAAEEVVAEQVALEASTAHRNQVQRQLGCNTQCASTDQMDRER